MKKFFDFFSSMYFAGTLMLIFAASIGTATFIENDYGTLAAQVVVYDARWFEILLVITALSLIGSIFKYRLIQRKMYMVLSFHLAFIIMLIGAGITRYFGYEGTMMIREGESSNQVISDNPYLQFTINDGTYKYQFDRSHLFTEFKRNKFNHTYSFGNKKCKLSFRQYIPKAAETIVEDPEGSPIIYAVTVEKGGRKSMVIKSGEQASVGDLNISFNSPKKDTSGLNIMLAGDSLKFTYPQVVSLTEMTAGSSKFLSKDSLHTLQPMKLYNFGDIQLVIRNFYKKGIVKLVTSPHGNDSDTPGAVIMDLDYNGKYKEMALMGGKGMIGKPVTETIDGISFTMAYGSKIIQIPFMLHLRDFQLERYPGSQSPSSFASEVTVIDPRKNLEMPYRIFMNNILNYGGFRFFQSSYDKDEKGTILSVNHDKWGTLVTYLGYIILAAGMILNLLGKNSRFRVLARATSKMKNSGKAAKSLLIVAVLSIISSGLFAQTPAGRQSTNIDSRHAKEFGKLLVQDKDGRIEPINTLASEILRKVSRKDKIMGLNSDQVFLGMITNPAYWQTVPMIKVSSSELKNMIGLQGNLASFSDFVDMEGGEYKLSNYVNEAYNKKPTDRSGFDKDVMKVDERVNICYMVYTGNFLNIFPKAGDPEKKWHDAEKPYTVFDSTSASFVSNILPSYYGAVLQAQRDGNWRPADETLGYIKQFQERNGRNLIPSGFKTNLEVVYNNINLFKRLFPFYALVGFILLIVLFVGILNSKVNLSILVRVMTILIALGFAVHTLGLAARWYIAGHAPWSNGFETMIYIAWGTVLSGLIFSRNSKITLAISAILASLTLMVANLSWMDPQITNLVPVLKSYWLVIHVAVITASYSFLAIGALLGFLNLVLIIFQNRKNYDKLNDTITELTNINEMNLIIGLLLVTIGTFLGAVWANESWGRYWGWDPKETWALVTVIVYAFVGHMRLIPGMRGVFAYNFAALIAISSVLMTYFGVNYYLSGMHSYASGDPVPIPNFVYYTIAIVAIVSLAAYINYGKMKKIAKSS